jgi:hypothetical protein
LEKSIFNHSNYYYNVCSRKDLYKRVEEAVELSQKTGNISEPARSLGIPQCIARMEN